MNIDAEGKVSWTPLDAQSGVNPITVSATDGTNVIKYDFNIDVTRVNDAPKFISTCEEKMQQKR